MLQEASGSRPAGEAGPDPVRRGRTGARFWGVAYAFLILVIGTNLPTPLYRSYESEFGFSPFMVTLIFAVYVATLIPSLLLIGSLSDAIGRRRVLLPALVVAGLGSLAFALATGIGWLLAARALQGVAVGAASGALTAALNELEPNGNRGRAALVSTVASIGAIAIGPMLAGVLAEFSSAPLVLPFVVEIVLLIPAAVAVARIPSKPSANRWRPRRPQIPAEMRSVFLAAGSATFLAFAVLGLFLTLIPDFVAVLTGDENLLLGGGVAALMVVGSTGIQILSHRQSARRLRSLGLPILIFGLGLLALVGVTDSFALLLVATLLAGVGHGLVFINGLTAVNDKAPADRRAEVLSSFYVIMYSGVGLPVLGVGVIATMIDLPTAVSFFAAVVGGAALLVLITRRRSGAVVSRRR